MTEPDSEALAREDAPPSGVFRCKPRVMLVRVEPVREPELCLADLPVELLRVRHPLPAIVRARILKPEVIVIGPHAHPRDVMLLLDTAFELGSAILQLSPLLAPEQVRGWVTRMLDVAHERRVIAR